MAALSRSGDEEPLLLLPPPPTKTMVLSSLKPWPDLEVLLGDGKDR